MFLVMKLSHHYFHNLEHYFKSDLSRIESFVFIHDIGRRLISIFLPIILFMEGFSLMQVLIYLLCYGVFDTVLNLVAREFIAKYGAKSAIVISLIFEISYFLGLIFLQVEWWFLIGLAFLAAVFDSFFYVGHWLIFNETIFKSKEVGGKIGTFNIIKSVGMLITPIIGAVFLVVFNKNYLIILSIAFFCLSLIPLFKISTKHIKATKKKNMIELFKDKKSRENFFLISFIGIHYFMEDVLLPLFIYLTFSSLENVGFLPIILAVGSIVFNYFIGHFVDRHERLNVITCGALALMVVWITRIFYQDVGVFFLTALFVGFFSTMLYIPIDSKLIRASKSSSFLDISTQRNFTYSASGIPVYLILIISLGVFDFSFMLAAFSMFMLVLIAQIFLRNKLHSLKMDEKKKNSAGENMSVFEKVDYIAK